jgi:CHAT domain-containing protein
LLPSTRVLFDRDFQPSAVIPVLNNYRVVHLATHAAFVTGKPEDSFILFGNGDRLTLRDIESWSLPNMDLFVLSACQTAVGGELGTGQEILGFGYQIQKAGAKAAIASLWSVDDNSTQVLMDQFYQSLNTPPNTPRLGINTALRQAQIAMIKQSDMATQRQGDIATQRQGERPKDFSHPFYWAPFILIGNGF